MCMHARPEEQVGCMDWNACIAAQALKFRGGLTSQHLLVHHACTVPALQLLNTVVVLVSSLQ